MTNRRVKRTNSSPLKPTTSALKLRSSMRKEIRDRTVWKKVGRKKNLVEEVRKKDSDRRTAEEKAKYCLYFSFLSCAVQV
ncbi:hypothetical protein M8J77_023733 [Diaphorina citri]|nr:hypothetical protein M8J77_023733 [Diaphorina citri]